MSISNRVEQLYLEHRDWLTLFIRRRTGCEDIAADLVQDTYLRLLSSGKLPDYHNSRRFLTHIAKGLVIDRYRHKRIEQSYLEYLQDNPTEHAPSPEKQAQMVEALAELDAILHKIPHKARQALLLSRLEGLSYKEIALQLNVSVSSVEKYIARALQSCLTTLLNT